MCLLSISVLIAYSSLAAGVNREFSFTVSDMCFENYNTVISDVIGITSPTECSIVCTRDGCCSFLFDATSKRCVTYPAVLPSTQIGCGWKYAEMDEERCKVPRPYRPQYPNTCTHGYSFDEINYMCVYLCTEYGSTFGTFEQYGINNFNHQVIANSSEQACKAACVEATGFVCRTAEMSIYGLCHLSEETALTQPTSYTIDVYFVLWQRNCASNAFA